MNSETGGERLNVLQCKFSAYLSWSQPFIHKLLEAVGEEVRNVVLCYRTENLDRFPVEDLVRIRARHLTEPRLAPQAADYLRERYRPDLIHAHLHEGAYGDTRILEPATAQEMHRQQFTHHPDMPGMTYGF